MNDEERAFLMGADWAIQFARTMKRYPTYQEALERAPMALARLAPSPAVEAKPTRKRKPKAGKPDGWSDGAWEFYKATQRAKTYGALDITNLSENAMRACDRNEEVRPNPTFRARFWHSEYAITEGNKAAVKLAKLGADGARIHFETPEEAYRKQLERRISETALSIIPDSFALARAERPDPYYSAIHEARDLCREALASQLYGMREEVRYLLRKVRISERAVKLVFRPHGRICSDGWMRRAIAHDYRNKKLSGSPESATAVA